MMSKVVPFRNGRNGFFPDHFLKLRTHFKKCVHRAIGVIGDWEWRFEWGGNVPSGTEVCPVESGLANTNYEETKISVIFQFCCCFRNFFMMANVSILKRNLVIFFKKGLGSENGNAVVAAL